MGLFGSGRRINVGTTVSRVIEDRLLPDSTKKGVVRAIHSNGDIVENIMEEYVSSIGSRAERMYRYAEQNYTYGLPSGEFYTPTQGDAAVSAVISQIEGGAPFTLNYSRFGPPNNLHIGWMQIANNHGYNSLTNQLGTLSASKGTPVYLTDLVVEIPENQLSSYQPGALDQWGVSARAGYFPLEGNTSSELAGLFDHTPVTVSSSITQEQVRVHYAWEELTATGLFKPNGDPVLAPTLIRDSFDVPTSVYDPKFDYFQASYTIGGVTKYWIYRAGAGTYPTLDALFGAPPEENGNFFPIAYFRFDSQNQAANTSTPQFQTTKKMLKYLGMDYETVAEAIEANPNIEDVIQAMLIMAVPANTDDPLELKYLYDFFDNWFYSSEEQYSTDAEAFAWSALINNPDINRKSIIIQDSRFKMALSNQGMFKKRVVGSIGAIGKHERGFAATIVYQPYVDELGSAGTLPYTMKYRYYRKQISEQFYDEIAILNLQMVYFLQDGYTVTADDVEDILLIPLDYSIVQNYQLNEREDLYARSLHYVFNSMTVTYVKWYQTSTFMTLIYIAAIVITIASLDPSLQALQAAIALGSIEGITAAALVILQNIAISFLVGAALKLFVKLVGVEAALLLALIAAAAGGWQVFTNGSLVGAPWANELLHLSLGLVKATSGVYSDLLQGVLGQMQEFALFAEEQTKLLDSAKELLETSSLLSPFTIFGESPDEFYNRTVHSGNIGVLGISAITNYVDSALTLPKLSETLQE